MNPLFTYPLPHGTSTSTLYNNPKPEKPSGLILELSKAISSDVRGQTESMFEKYSRDRINWENHKACSERSKYISPLEFRRAYLKRDSDERNNSPTPTGTARHHRFAKLSPENETTTSNSPRCPAESLFQEHSRKHLRDADACFNAFSRAVAASPNGRTEHFNWRQLLVDLIGSCK